MEAIAPPKAAIHLGAKMEGNRATGVERQAKRVYLAYCVYSAFLFLVFWMKNICLGNQLGPTQ